MAETKYTHAIQRFLKKKKTEALEKHANTVTMRADTLYIKESDFFRTVLGLHEEAQHHMNAVSAPLNMAAPAADHAPKAA